MPKRQPKPEPITPEEVMGSPALQGFDTFLRYRSVEEHGPVNREAEESATGANAERMETPDQIDKSPIPISPIGVSPIGIPPVGRLPVSLSDPDGSAALTIPEFKPVPRIRRAVKAQDGHSAGEQAVYLALWNTAALETPDTRLIRIGYGGLQSLCGLDKTNCKDNIQSLIRKLAVEVVSPFKVEQNQGNGYRIFSPGAIMKRRKAAGMEWVIRNKGVRFVEHTPAGE